MAHLNVKYRREIQAVSPEAMDRLCRCAWPGNVRQLEHAIEHAFVVTPRGAAEIVAGALPPGVTRAGLYQKLKRLGIEA